MIRLGWLLRALARRIDRTLIHPLAVVFDASGDTFPLDTSRLDLEDVSFQVFCPAIEHI
jgi:hypothetical protein